MKKDTSKIEKYRVKDGPLASTSDYGLNGIFIIPYQRVKLIALVSDAFGWDHVSVSVQNKKRCPKWAEMKHVKNLFFKADEIAIQFHPPEENYINDHPYVLHIWRPQYFEIQLPPVCMV